MTGLEAGTLSLGAALASPAPSRAELATETRIITAQSLARFADEFGSDYRHVENPGQLLPMGGRFQVPERMRAFFLSSRELDARLDRTLHFWLKGGPVAQKEAKQLALRMSGMTPDAAAATDIENAALIARLRVSDEGQEGLTAFLEKRRPSWV